ncbi:MAG TPA: substrate-binding domain-containing protein, partial [Ramlibacter sp.]|nr:substrate-binding domain-containing protein [Ramlibacter sp.]
LRELLLHRPAGLLVTGVDRSEASRRLIANSGIPCVHLMEAAQRSGVYSVGLSQEEAGAAMTRHLVARGYKRIAFGAAQLDARVMQRMAGWQRELSAAGLHERGLEWLNPEPSSIALGARMFEQIMAQPNAVDAIFFCNDDLAQGALLAALRMGVEVPGRVAIAGFNDITGSDQMLPALTTVRTPRAEIGRAAASMLLDLMSGRPVADACIDVGFELVAREST